MWDISIDRIEQEKAPGVADNLRSLGGRLACLPTVSKLSDPAVVA